MASKSGFAPITLFAHLLAIAVTTLVLVWLLHFREGLAFSSSNKPKIFNLHPLLMVIGFVLFSGEAIIAYKAIPVTRTSQKYVHMTLNLIALAAGILGLIAVFKFHNELQITNMYSLHSWLGISTICLFALQWLFGFVIFFFPRAEMSTRAKFSPWHALLGMAIFFMSILTAETGLVEKFTFLRLRRNQEALIINFAGLLILLFGITVFLTVLHPRY